jgi:hypothetical protein
MQMAILYKAWVCGSPLAETVVSYPAGDMDALSLVSVVCCQDRGLCVGLITRPEESHLQGTNLTLKYRTDRFFQNYR